MSIIEIDEDPRIFKTGERDSPYFSAANGRSQCYLDIAAGPFFGANRQESKAARGMINSFWFQGMQAGSLITYECIKAFSETDFTGDLKKVDIPVLIIHGDMKC